MDRPDRNWLRRFRRNLRAWYDVNARDLPWRRSSDPYRIWISEIMLQQTTVSAVIPYYERFLKRFPTVHSIAEASETDVLRYWEGLGYYSRARNIHDAAQRIVREHAGTFPDSVGELMNLPGIGRYTAGAIVSFAFDRPAPIVEANTLRLYCRLLGFDGDPRASRGQRVLWRFAEQLQVRNAPGRFNQALMELGAHVCTPVEPNCDRCPVKSCCRAFAAGEQRQIPVSASRPNVTAVTEATVAVINDGAFLLRRRSEGERWAGLWDFPRFEIDGFDVPCVDSALARRTDSRKVAKVASPTRPRRSQSQAGLGGRASKQPIAAIPRTVRKRLTEQVTRQTGIDVELGELLTEIRHSVTRYRIRLLCLLATYRSGSVDNSQQFIWVTPTDLAEYPLSTTGRKLAELLQKRFSQQQLITARRSSRRRAAHR